MQQEMSPGVGWIVSSRFFSCSTSAAKAGLESAGIMSSSVFKSSSVSLWTLCGFKEAARRSLDTIFVVVVAIVISLLPQHPLRHAPTPEQQLSLPRLPLPPSIPLIIPTFLRSPLLYSLLLTPLHPLRAPHPRPLRLNASRQDTQRPLFPHGVCTHVCACVRRSVCEGGGVGGTRKTEWVAEILGVGLGGFSLEMGVQIVDICMSTRERNGGVIEMPELIPLLSKLRGHALADQPDFDSVGSAATAGGKGGRGRKTWFVRFGC
jgi:hypothetical protein